MTVEEHFLFVGSLTCDDADEMRKRSIDLLGVLGLSDKKNWQV
jgi:hypothetical protein